MQAGFRTSIGIIQPRTEQPDRAFIPETSLSVSRPEKRQNRNKNVILEEGLCKSPAWPSAGFLQVRVTLAQQQQCWLAAQQPESMAQGRQKN